MAMNFRGCFNHRKFGQLLPKWKNRIGTRKDFGLTITYYWVDRQDQKASRQVELRLNHLRLRLLKLAVIY